MLRTARPAGEAVLLDRVAQAGAEGQARSEALKERHESEYVRAVAAKRPGRGTRRGQLRSDRLQEDAATKRAVREERAAAAAGRRCLSEATLDA